MRYSEIIDERLLNEQAFPLKDIRNRLMALNDQINQHILLVLSCKEDTIYINHWKNEILAWLTNIYNMKIKTKGTPSIPISLYTHYMWNGPFGEHAESTMTDMIAQLYRAKPDIVRNDRSIGELVKLLQQFHHDAAIVIQNHGDIDGLVQSLK